MKNVILFPVAYQFCCAFYNLCCCDNMNFPFGGSIKSYSILSYINVDDCNGYLNLQKTIDVQKITLEHCSGGKNKTFHWVSRCFFHFLDP